MSLMEASVNSNLTSCWEDQSYDPLLPTYKDRLHPKINLHHTPLGDYFSYIFDFHKSRIVYLGATFDDITGYRQSRIPATGLKFLQSVIHPADARAAFLSYQTIWQYLMQLPLGLRHQFKATMDYRIKRSNGEYLRVLQEMQNFIADDLGNIVYVTGLFTDITHWGRKKDVSLIMEDPIHLQKIQIPCLHKNLQLFLSKREREILKLLACGKSSKAVADDLAISYHTVNTHRQNMLSKLGMRKTAGLVNFAVNNGII